MEKDADVWIICRKQNVYKGLNLKYVSNVHVYLNCIKYKRIHFKRFLNNRHADVLHCIPFPLPYLVLNRLLSLQSTNTNQIQHLCADV